MITDGIRPNLHAYMATVFADSNSPATLINSVEDHVHILFNLSRTVTIAKVVEETKKSSSKWLKGASGKLLVTDYAVKKSVSEARNGRLSKDNRSFLNEAHDFLGK